MIFGSLFAGIGGFDLGLEWAGMTCRWQVEQDSKRCWILHQHFGERPIYREGKCIGRVPRHMTNTICRDVRSIPDKGTGALEHVDLVCGGSPCVDLSLAGSRAGLDGSESGLFWEFIRLIRALSPRWLLFENVVGLLTSNAGRDMGAVLGALGECGYGWAYRVLNLQLFGRPQTRRRVFIVGCLGDTARAAKVLFEQESCSGDSSAGDINTHIVAGGFGKGNEPVAFHEDQRSGAVYENDHTHALTTGGGKPGQGYQAVRIGDTVRKLTSLEWERLQGFPDNWTEHPNLTDAKRQMFIGDSVSPIIIEWIGRRILEAAAVRREGRDT